MFEVIAFENSTDTVIAAAKYDLSTPSKHCSGMLKEEAFAAAQDLRKTYPTWFIMVAETDDEGLVNSWII